VTLRPYDEDDSAAEITTELIVPVGSLRRITLAATGAAHAKFGFARPEPS
jgi:hypothetical protein